MSNGGFLFGLSFSELLKMFEKPKISPQDVQAISRHPEEIAEILYGGRNLKGGKEEPGLLSLYHYEHDNPLSGNDTMSVIDLPLMLLGPAIGYVAGIATERMGEADTTGAFVELGWEYDSLMPTSRYAPVLALATALYRPREEQQPRQ